jgi:hypothetical protein
MWLSSEFIQNIFKNLLHVSLVYAKSTDSHITYGCSSVPIWIPMAIRLIVGKYNSLVFRTRSIKCYLHRDTHVKYTEPNPGPSTLDYITIAQVHCLSNPQYKNDRQLSKSKLHLFTKLKFWIFKELKRYKMSTRRKTYGVFGRLFPLLYILFLLFVNIFRAV